MPDKNITFEIREYLGVISKNDSGWCKELNVISWNGQSPKYDLRDWDPHHERMSRGITLHPSEMRKMVDLYLTSNNKKRIEEGQTEEQKKQKRQEEFRKSFAEKKQDQMLETVEAEAAEGAVPPAEDVEQGSSEVPFDTEAEQPTPLTENQMENSQQTAEAESF